MGTSACVDAPKLVRAPIVFACALLALLMPAGCRKKPELPIPPRATGEPVTSPSVSTVAVPITISLDNLQQVLERHAPRTLWAIDEKLTCLSGRQVRVLGRDVKVTPDIACHIQGQVTRGRMAVSGRGQELTIAMPVSATIHARDADGILKGETATGSAVVHARVRLSLDEHWEPRAKVDISYDWSEPPGIDFLGQRIRFAQRADRELVRVIAGLEREVQREVARQNIRSTLQQLWNQGFTVISLNREKPPAWMRITPTGLGFAGYRARGRTLELGIIAQATTETFITDDKPEASRPSPLPERMAQIEQPGLAVNIPVMADYAQLEPVLLHALRRLAAKGIRVEGLGSVNADFRGVTIYATDNGRLAVGIDAAIEPVGERTGRWARAEGKAWLTGLPVTVADSQIVRVRDLQIYGEADQMAANILIQVLSSDMLKGEIAAALTQNFSKDYAEVIDVARRAIADMREGPLRMQATIDEVRHQAVQVTGAGLFMPVQASGSATVTLDLRQAL